MIIKVLDSYCIYKPSNYCCMYRREQTRHLSTGLTTIPRGVEIIGCAASFFYHDGSLFDQQGSAVLFSLLG